MSTRRTNLGLLAALTTALATGVLAFGIGTRWVVVVIVAHGMAGLAVVIMSPWKTVIARRGFGRRTFRAVWPSVALGLLVVVTVVSGILRTAGIVRSWGPLTDMQVHVGAALLTIPFGLWHILARGPWPSARDLDRRNLVRALGVVGLAAGAMAASEGAWRLFGLPGGRRRFTGSHERGSHDPARMPVVQWLDDRVAHLDGSAWRLTVTHRDGSTDEHGIEALDVGDRLTATLDCTGGWWAEQDWSGIRLDRLLPDIEDARSVRVVSVTGYSRRLPVRDLSHLLLATRMGGAPLSAGHGFPARLVAPGRRGFWWVKWVTRIELSARPWWLDIPFPTT
ncbi:MAG: molybdopterin-dependent oxidoreductase [Nitriliruptorales bacterium]|nr:molybdopterin-dependent oxidoreductase [Nitriliruptorales bacterium]